RALRGQGIHRSPRAGRQGRVPAVREGDLRGQLSARVHGRAAEGARGRDVRRPSDRRPGRIAGRREGVPAPGAGLGPGAPPGDAKAHRLVVMPSDVTRARLVRLPWDYEQYGLDPDTQRVADAVRA